MEVTGSLNSRVIPNFTIRFIKTEGGKLVYYLLWWFGLASKDQMIGLLIFAVCIIVAIGYVVLIFVPGAVSWMFPWVPMQEIPFWAVAVVVLLAFLVVMFIGAWIGWTMATTPPPKPIEEIEKEVEAETKEEEKVVEEKAKDLEKAETETKEKEGIE